MSCFEEHRKEGETKTGILDCVLFFCCLGGRAKHCILVVCAFISSGVRVFFMCWCHTVPAFLSHLILFLFSCVVPLVPAFTRRRCKSSSPSLATRFKSPRLFRNSPGTVRARHHTTRGVVREVWGVPLQCRLLQCRVPSRCAPLKCRVPLLCDPTQMRDAVSHHSAVLRSAGLTIARAVLHGAFFCSAEFHHSIVLMSTGPTICAGSHHSAVDSLLVRAATCTC